MVHSSRYNERRASALVRPYNFIRKCAEHGLVVGEMQIVGIFYVIAVELRFMTDHGVVTAEFRSTFKSFKSSQSLTMRSRLNLL